ncbi:MAG: tyrosine-type recombinase/integrase [Pseudomonadota bacterium]
MTVEKAMSILNELKNNQRQGAGPVTLQEKRELEQVRKENERTKAEQLDKESMTFSSLFEIYLNQQQADGKKSWQEEQRLYKNWIEPVVGKLRLLDIAPIHFERIKSNMKATSKRKDWGGLSARSISYCLAVCRQVFNYGRKQDHFHGDNPVSKVKKPVADNRRMRFLTHQEAQMLLDEIRVHSVLTYRITLLSLHCGLRFGEIAGLMFQDLNFQDDTILIRDPKNGQTRVGFMTEAVKVMILEMEPGKAGDFVFKNTGKNDRMSQIPDTFMKAVNKIGLNDSVVDSRLKVVFHSCRHSFASWLVADGTDLFQVKELMGHKTLAMTARYSHLSPDTLKKAVKSMESAMSQGKVIQIRRAG